MSTGINMPGILSTELVPSLPQMSFSFARLKKGVQKASDYHYYETGGMSGDLVIIGIPDANSG